MAHDDDHHHTPHTAQAWMFMFVTSKVFFEVVSIVMDARPWMRHFLSELSEAALWSAVAYTFRLAHPDVFAVVPPPPLPSLVTPFPGEPMSPSVPHIVAMPEGLPPTVQSRHALTPHSHLSIVVIENPCAPGDQGESVESHCRTAASTMTRRSTLLPDSPYQPITCASKLLGQLGSRLLASRVGPLEAQFGEV